MYVLNLEKAIQMVKSSESVPLQGMVLPDEIDKDKFETFFRIMEASAPEDIEDISLEEIISMWNYLNEFVPLFEEKECLASMALRQLPSKHSVMRRRIL